MFIEKARERHHKSWEYYLVEGESKVMEAYGSAERTRFLKILQIGLDFLFFYLFILFLQWRRQRK